MIAINTPGKGRAPGRPEVRWMLLIHHIPPTPAYLRVKIGRHLHRMGAVAIKNSVYALPRNDETQEDFQWVLREIMKGGGDASLIEARFIEGLSDEQVTRLFQAAPEADHRELAEQARAVAAGFPKRGAVPENRRAELAGQVARLRQRVAELAAIEFFGAPGRRGPPRSWHRPFREPVFTSRGDEALKANRLLSDQGWGLREKRHAHGRLDLGRSRDRARMGCRGRSG